jgi:hypothetical protein
MILDSRSLRPLIIPRPRVLVFPHSLISLPVPSLALYLPRRLVAVADVYG